MSAHNVKEKIHSASPARDPGNAGVIVVDRSPQFIPLVSAAAETRTLSRPTREGAILILHLKTDGGNITMTVTGGYNEVGNTTLVFTDAGQVAMFVSCYDGTDYFWRLFTNLAQTLTIGAGVGITAGVGTVYKNSVRLDGGLYYTTILIDLTGLGSSTTDLDVIGVAGGPAHLGQITAAQNGTILAVRMTCLELPATGADDIDLYSATVGTAVFDDGIAALTETELIASGGAWASGTTKGSTIVPPANDYLYLVNGEAGTVGTYTAGKFLIELIGY